MADGSSTPQAPAAPMPSASGPAGPTTQGRVSSDDEQRQLASVRAELVREFGDRLSPEDVHSRFAETVGQFDGAPIRSFVPVLAQRSVRQELRRVLATA